MIGTLGTLALLMGLPALIGGVGSLISNGINAGVNFGMQKDSQAFNSAEAQKQREWQSQENEIARNFEKDMSSTAFSRQVADMKNAGLNPGAIGAGASGAFTPSAPVGTGYAASSGAAHVAGGNNAGINGYLNSVVSQAAIKTLKQNPNMFGNNVSQAARYNSVASKERVNFYNYMRHLRGLPYYEDQDSIFTDEEIDNL